MLNTTSAYFKDQLLEKLQIMLATRELYILGFGFETEDVVDPNNRAVDTYIVKHTVTFQVSATQEEWPVEYKSSDRKLNLPEALRQLAEDMTSTMHSYLSARLVEVNV